MDDQVDEVVLAQVLSAICFGDSAKVDVDDWRDAYELAEKVVAAYLRRTGDVRGERKAVGDGWEIRTERDELHDELDKRFPFIGDFRTFCRETV